MAISTGPAPTEKEFFELEEAADPGDADAQENPQEEDDLNEHGKTASGEHALFVEEKLIGSRQWASFDEFFYMWLLTFICLFQSLKFFICGSKLDFKLDTAHPHGRCVDDDAFSRFTKACLGSAGERLPRGGWKASATACLESL
jgi:hypothetical protein